jgi:S1-C subfamily serine protease
MSGKVRYWSFIGVLAVGVVAAVSALAAQGARVSRELQAPGERRELMFLDGRGSRLGVMVQDLEATDKTGGVRVDSVDPESPAEKAGLKTGDVVVEYDGERVRSARQFTRLVQETPEGRQVPLAVLRDGKRQDLTATPEARRFSWEMNIDGDRIRRDVERGLREFRMDMPPMRFRWDHDFDDLLAPSSRRRLGISVDSMGDQLSQYFGASEGGALITSVEPGSAAEKAGLKAGDVITSINGERVRDAEQVVDTMREVGDGEVTIGYLRDKKAGTTKATIEPRSAPGANPGEPRRPVRPAAYMRPV